MSGISYDTEAYRRFYENLLPLLKGPNIKTMKLRELKKYAESTAWRTRFNSLGWRSMVSSRIGPRTVYLGSDSVVQPSPTDIQKDLIEKAPAELHNVLHFLRTLPFIHLRRQMGWNGEYNPVCNLYVSVADPKNYRLAYMWGNTQFKPTKRPGPEFTMIHIPEEHNIRQQVLTIPEHNLNIALGTDYMGEDKKGFLRQAMWTADGRGMLGLHAGTKTVTVRDHETGRLKNYGVYLFGLSATGKSTWSCHQLGLNLEKKEMTRVNQDDIVFMKRDGGALGTEGGFFVKTDVDKTLQESMYNALIHKSALYENVMIDANGEPDFLDESLCGNGRAVIQKRHLRIKHRNRMIRIEAKGVNLPAAEELDGVIFAFITRRNTIMPFAQRLTPEQAVLAYLWGESSHSFASQPAKAGESVRTVGTDPFIIGSRAAKVNTFFEIISELCERFPDKISFYQYNTGGIGEILEERVEDGRKKKNMIRKAKRVPIDLMAALQRGDLYGTNRYEKGRFGTREIVRCEGGSLAEYDPARYYSKEEIDTYLEDIVAGREKFTGEIVDEGLTPEVLRFAEQSYGIVKDRSRVFIAESKKPGADETAEDAHAGTAESVIEPEFGRGAEDFPGVPVSLRRRPGRSFARRKV